MHRLAPCLLLAPVLVAAEPAKAGTGPSVEEVVLLQTLNFLRADARRGEEIMLEAIAAKAIPVTAGIWARQGAPVAPVPPLAFSPALMAAARSLLAAGTVSPNDKKPFDAKPALVAAGYANVEKGGTALFGSGTTLPHAFASACTNITGEYLQAPPSTYKHDYYSAREGWSKAWREAGVAVSAGAKGYSAVIVLGAGTAARHLGGVAYVDANRNGRYDPGEGKAGVTVACGDQQMVTGAAGAWWLTGAKLEEAKLTFSGEGSTTTRPVAKDAANLTLDWRLPIPADLKTADKLIADAEKAPADPDKRRAPLAALLVGTLRLVVDDARQQKIDTLVAPVRFEFEGTRKRILAALGEEPAIAAKAVADQKKQWPGTMSAWFKEADALVALRRQVVAAQAAPAAEQGKLAAPLLPLLAKAQTTSIDPVLLAQYETWEAQMAALAPAAAEKATGKKK